MKNKLKNKVKEIHLPMKWNVALDKFEPVLPLRKGNSKEVIKRKRNKWAFWFILILIILYLLEILVVYIINKY